MTAREEAYRQEARFKEAKRALVTAIGVWQRAAAAAAWAPSTLPQADRARQAVDEAITALDNAAYDRAFRQAHEHQHEQCHRQRRELAAERDELQRLFDERERERDALRQDLESAQRRRAREASDADQLLKERDKARRQDNEARCIISSMSRTAEASDRVVTGLTELRDHLHAELADAQSDLGIRDRDADDRADDAIRLREELADARETIRRLADDGSVEHLAQRVSTLRGELREAQNTIKNLRALVKTQIACSARTYGRESRVAERWQTEADRLHKALETLADRYHAQVCYRKPRHRRQTCSLPPLAVQDAEKALGTVRIDFHGIVDHVATSDRMLTSEEVKEAHRVLFDDRKPEQPEIEAVLMGSTIKCACGCDWIIERGHVAYRFVKDVLAEASLFLSPEHARKAARPKARTHPPYAAYTDAMRREEERCRCALHREQS